jgi:hypothetical protein
MSHIHYTPPGNLSALKAGRIELTVNADEGYGKMDSFEIRRVLVIRLSERARPDSRVSSSALTPNA